MTLDLQRLIKLLNLTCSDNDHEALAAIRMANKMVMAWADVVQQPMKGFDRIAQPAPNTWGAQSGHYAEWSSKAETFSRNRTIAPDMEMVNYCLRNCDIGSAAMLEQLHAQLCKRMPLDEQQRTFIRKLHSEIQWRGRET